MKKKRILMVCEAFGGGVFTYVSQLCNDMVDEFDVYLAYSLRPQTPKNYTDFLDQRVHLIEMENVGVKGLTNLKSDIAAIKELRQIEKDVQPDVIHLHSSVAGGLGRLAYKGKNNTVVYTPHGYAHILMGPGKKSKIYKFAEKVLGNKALTLTCCESEDEEAKKFSRRTAYVETGVNLADLSASLDGIEPVKNDKFTVFTLGRACVQKQPQLFNKIAELVPEAQFIWIGNGELENELTAPNIEVTGWKPRKEALAMAKGADAFILCSLGEAIAMSLIENKLETMSTSYNIRSDDWSACLRVFFSSPIWGVGINNYKPIYNSFSSAVYRTGIGLSTGLFILLAQTGVSIIIWPILGLIRNKYERWGYSLLIVFLVLFSVTNVPYKLLNVLYVGSILITSKREIEAKGVV